MLPALEVERPVQEDRVNLRGKSVPAAKNRGRLDVVADMVGACFRPASKNSLLIRANVNSVTATYLLAQLMDSRLLDTVVDEEGKVAYIATKHGMAFVNSYRNLTTMLTPSLVPETKSREQVGLFA
jgi:predicted transcriptional regulator